MPCSSTRPPKKAPKILPPIPGAKGFVKVTYIGPEPTLIQHGQETRAIYEFIPGKTLSVDIGDAVHLVGPEFEVL